MPAEERVICQSRVGEAVTTRRTLNSLMILQTGDVARDTAKSLRASFQSARCGKTGIDTLLESSAALADLKQRMAKYIEFSKDFGSFSRGTQAAGSWWHHRVELEEGISLRLCGLNTALLSADDEDHGKLRVGQRQLSEFFLELGERELPVVLGHHPATTGWLADENDLQGKLDRH